MFFHPTCWVRTDIPLCEWYVRPSESLADGIAHKSRGQKRKLPFPIGAKTLLPFSETSEENLLCKTS